MKEVYKRKAEDLIAATEGRVKLVQMMMEGRKAANQKEAEGYLREVMNGLDKLNELISIS